jgi:hypothetical protein
MIIRDLDMVCITAPPHEAKPPLIVDANAVLSLSFPTQFFQTTGG